MRPLKVKKFKRIQRIQFTPDGTRLLVLGGAEARGVDYVVWLDVASGEEVDRLDVFAESAAVSADGQRIVGGDFYLSRTLGKLCWRTVGDSNWTPIAVPRGANLAGVAFSPDGEFLVAGIMRRIRKQSDDPWQSSVVCWQLDPFQQTALFDVHTSPVKFAFDAERNRIACTGGIDGEPLVGVHDLTTGKIVYGYRPKGTQSRGLMFDANGRLAVVNSKWVYVLPPAGGTPEFVLESDAKQMNAAVFSPDGRRILTGGHDGSLRVWNATDGKPLQNFDWEIGAVTAVAFAPDGLTCAAAGMNGRIVLWDVDQ